MKIAVKILENSISEAPLDTVAKLTGTTGQKKAAAKLASAFPLAPKKSWKDITLLALKGLKVAVKSKNINDINKFIRQADDALYDHDPTHPARETLNQLRNYSTKKLSALAASGDASEVDTAIRQVMYEQTNIREIEEITVKNTQKNFQELKQIIAQESIKLIMEQSEDPSEACLEDFKQIQKLYSRICKLMNAQFNKKIKKIEDLMSKQDDEDPEAFIRGVQDELGSRKFYPGTGGSGSGSQTYTVKSGDTYWDLATKFLGNPRRWPEIVSANQDLLSGRPQRKFAKTPGKLPVIRPGDKLTIPGK